jgi:hypothetical protein
MKKLAILLLVISLVFANGDTGSFSKFFNDTTKSLEVQGDNFVQVAGAQAQGVRQTFTSVYEAFGSGSCGDQWLSTAGGPAEIIGLWLTPSVLVVMAVLLGIGSIYMVGQFLSSPGLIALAKDEVFQTALTILRVVVLIAVLAAAETWYAGSSSGSTDLVYQAKESMIDGALSFARHMVSEMSKHYSMLLMYNMVIHTIYSSTMWFGVTWRAMYSFNLGPVLKPLIDILGTALQFLSLGMSSWLLHVVTLCLIKKWMWALFIPMSVLLRAFPYTRNAGEALFALAFSLALFYPFMFLFDYEAHKIMKYNIADPKDAVSNFIHKSGLLSVFAPVLAIMFLMAGVFMPFFLGAALTIAFELIRGAVYYIVIISILLPFLNIFVTLTAAREIASFFRVDVNFMSFLRII